MIIADSHCDTLTALMETNSSFSNNHLHIDIKRMMKYQGYLQFFAAYISPQYYHSPNKRAKSIIKKAYQLEKRYGEVFKICKRSEDIRLSLSKNRICGILSIEGGEALEGKVDNVDAFYRSGVRCMSLTWNNDNDLADGAMEGKRNNGLSELGKSVVKRMEKRHMLVDVSHLSEKSFWDVIKIARRPVIATHSNARALCSHERNLTDRQIKAIGDVGGIIGINLYPVFLDISKKATVHHIIEHIEYISSIVGKRNICLGADFDGIDIVPEDIRGIQHITKISEALIKKKFSKSFIDGFMGKNLIRFLTQNL